MNETQLSLRDQCLAMADEMAFEDYGASVDRVDEDDLESCLEHLKDDGSNMAEIALEIAALAHFFN